MKEEINWDSSKACATLQEENDRLKAELKETYTQLTSAEHKIAELQPFERGAEGWAMNQLGELEKCKYIARSGKHDIVETHNRICVVRSDFTTENPHKNETVWRENTDKASFVNHQDDYVLYVLDTNRKIIHAHMADSVWKIHYRELGDDLKVKFDDPENKKYISLI